MRFLTSILLLFLICNDSSGTNQIKDILIYNGDTLDLYESPLEQASGVSPIQLGTELYGEDHYGVFSSECWRGFIAEWEVVDSILYLTSVTECHTSKNINGIVEKLTGKRFIDGRIKADWVFGEFWCGKGFVPVQSLYISIYEHEYQISFNKGRIIEQNDYHYIPCELGTSEHLKEFIFNKINWDQCPSIENRKFEISGYVESDELGTINRVSIENNLSDEFVPEIKRILWTLPCINVYFNEGEYWDVGMSFRIVINEENKLKYVR